MKILQKTVIFLTMLFFCLLTNAKSIKVQIIGVKEKYIAEDIISAIQIKDLSKEKLAVIQEKLTYFPHKIRKILQSFGYFNAKIFSKITQKNNNFFATYHINPGERITIKKLNMELSGPGADDKIFTDILKKFSHFPGKKFSSIEYNDLKNQLLHIALANGYLDAKFSFLEVKVNLKTYLVYITVKMNTGQRYKFGEIYFNTNPYNSQFLKKFAGFKTGEFYSNKKLYDFQEALSASEYFKDVFVSPELLQKKYNTVPIKVYVTPLPKTKYNFGVGFGTDSGPRVVENYESRRLTPFGERLKEKLQLSTVTSIFSVDYIIPGAKPATDQYVISTASKYLDQVSGKSASAKVGVSKITLQSNDWQRTIGINLQYERWALSHTNYNQLFFLLPSASWMKVVQDDPVITHKGYKLNFITLGSPPILNNTPFIQAQVLLKSIWPIFSKNQLLARANIGYTLTQNVDKVPLSLQLLAGGTQSMRGYQYNQMGPGINLVVTSIEYRQHVKNNWYAAAFIDAGEVSNHLSGDLKKSLGIGVVWQSPVGTLELTIAKAVDEPGKPNIIQFSMGPEL